jgi:ribosomal peptide maturation radical SAM protein 1
MVTPSAISAIFSPGKFNNAAWAFPSSDLMKDLCDTDAGANSYPETVLIVPPFASLQQPVLGPHVIQACARTAGFPVRVLYANLSFAAHIGVERYRSFSDHSSELIGERIFAASAFFSPPLGRRSINDDARLIKALQQCSPKLSLAELLALEETVEPWLDSLVRELAGLNVQVVGCSTTFEQTAASIAILNRLKVLRPEAITIIGGANCEGPMAEGIRLLSRYIDFVFSGESEDTFLTFLQAVKRGRVPPTSIIKGTPCEQLDGLPEADFTDYYAQLEKYLPNHEALAPPNTWLPYESSRGCWWGEKFHCTFCGLNGETMSFRTKSADRVLAALKDWHTKHPSLNICMSDNIMPHAYFKTLLPRLADESLGLRIFYEQKAKLTLERVMLLSRAGVVGIQPGIESLSTFLLRRMQKGVTARQNIELMRYARSVNLSLEWGLLYGFPGDLETDYLEQIRLIPLLTHLPPPSGVRRLVIERFSPYFVDPGRYGISAIVPWESYRSVLPEDVDASAVAYHFDGIYESGGLKNPKTITLLTREVGAWQEAWFGGRVPPRLEVSRVGSDEFLICDTRPAGAGEFAVDGAQASVALTGSYVEGTDEVENALERGWAVRVDDSVLPLATCSPELFREFNQGVRTRGRTLPVLR